MSNQLRSLENKKILLAVSGSIAVYKSLVLCRLLVKSGAEVKVMMTQAAEGFVGKLSFSTLSNNEVFTDVSSDGEWRNHVELGLWADLMIVAPCTANTLAKMANGICDNMLNAVFLSARCPVCIAPAMDVDMWKHATTQKNIDYLKSIGNRIIPVGYGFLASGLEGEGRMAEPEEIVDFICDQYFDISSKPLYGLKALITAGPTYEAIDPVRYVGNWSSGRMGIALADALAYRGADVKLVLGPSNLKPKQDSVEVINIVSAKDMLEACEEHWGNTDIGIMAAAVADYAPKKVADQKLKKKEASMSLQLVKTADIAATLGKSKGKNQVLVGFALETNNGKQHALQKLKKKNLDFIVLNNPNIEGAGFNTKTNKVNIFHADEKEIDIPLKSKNEVAEDIVNEIIKLLSK